jgi:hypothetical protein
VTVSGNRKWIAVGVVAGVIAAALAYLGTPAARAALAVEFVAFLVVLGLRQGRTERNVQALKRGQKALANVIRDQEIETGLAALNRYATLAGRDLDKTPDASD